MAVVWVSRTMVPAGSNRPAVPDKPAYVGALVPRVSGFAHTAPVYDDVTKPVDAPYPVACLVGSACRCYDQSANVLPMPVEVCGDLVKAGFFKSWERRK